MGWIRRDRCTRTHLDPQCRTLSAGTRQDKTLDDLKPLSFNYEELVALIEPAGVSRVVLIQHQPFHGFDNRYILHAAGQYPDIFRVVAQIDDHRDDAGDLMRSLLKKGVTGIRITPLLSLGRVGWLERAGTQGMWRVGADSGQSLCCLIDPIDLPAVDRMCGRFPQTPVVIDHLARIGADGTIRDGDVSQLCRLARHPLVTAKISAFYALGAKQPPYLDLAPMIRRVFEAYGPERLWASDSPCQLEPGHTYDDSITLVRDRLDCLTENDRDSILHKTAERVYFF